LVYYYPSLGRPIPKMAPSPQGKRWCFTINNHTEADVNSVIDLAEHPDRLYLVVGDEVADTGTPHLQGYVVLSKNWRQSKLSRHLPRARLALARGTSAENRAYCTKEGRSEEYGECPTDTRISSSSNACRWQVAYDLARSDRLTEIDPMLQIRYFRSLSNIRDAHRPTPAINPRLANLWIWGTTGVGKTKFCFDNFPNHYIKSRNKWWCGYANEPVVCIQEYGKGQEKLSEYLKEWTDHYPFRVEYKGGSQVINCKALIVTSNWAPDELWQEDQVLLPLLRRFHVVKFPEERVPDEVLSFMKSL